MAIGPIQLIRQATPGQRRTLLAASMGWALDAFDAMLYSLVLALLMRDLGMSKTLAGSLGTLTLLASGIGGVLFGFLAADGQHSDVLDLFLRLWTGDDDHDARGGPIRPWPRDGRRMEYRRDSGRRELAHGISGEGYFHRAEFVGIGIRGRRPRRWSSSTLLRLASGVLCRNLAGNHHIVDSAQRAGIGDVAGPDVSGPSAGSVISIECATCRFCCEKRGFSIPGHKRTRP